MLAPMKVRGLSKEEAYTRGMNLLKKLDYKIKKMLNPLNFPVVNSNV